MKKIFLIALSSFLLLFILACENSYSYSYSNTSQASGYDSYYLSGTEIILDPVIYVGYTTEEWESRGSSDYYVKNWLIESFSYTLAKQADQTYVEIESDSVVTGVDETEYSSSSTGYYDYQAMVDDMFNFGVLPDGHYQFQLTTNSKYISYTDSRNSRTENPQWETYSQTTTYEFTVGEYAGEINTKTVLMTSQYLEDFKSAIEGFDKDGNPLTYDDIVVIDDVLSRLQDYQVALDNLWTFANFAIEYENYINASDEEGINQKTIDYSSNYFDLDNLEGYTFSYIANRYYFARNYGDSVLNITVKLKGSNVYQNIRVLFEPDTTEPVFSNVPSDQTITFGDSLNITQLMPSAIDDNDGDVSADITVDVADTSLLAVGDHTVTFTVEDSFGNEATASFIIHVLPLDTTEPEITVNTGLPTTFTVGDLAPDFVSYFDVIDDSNGSITVTQSMLSWDTEIDMNTAGTYHLTINVSDSSGNFATETVTFIVEEPAPDLAPVFRNLPDAQSINEGETLDLLNLGVTAFDAVDGDLSNSITVNITDTSVLASGEHTVTYSVTDSANNTITASFILTVNTVSQYSGELVFASAVEPSVIYIEFDVDMLDNLLADPAAFSVLINGGPATLIDVSVGMLSVSVTVEQVISIGDVVSVDYLRTGIDDLTYGGVLVPEFVSVSVDTSNIISSNDYTGSVMVAMAYDANTIDITFDVDTFDLSFIDESAFTVYIDGVEATIISSFVNIDTVTLGIVETMTDMSFIEVSYAPTGNSDLSYGGVLVPGFSDEVVIPPMGGMF